jgi:hypothetical protein
MMQHVWRVLSVTAATAPSLLVLQLVLRPSEEIGSSAARVYAAQ